MGLFLLIPVFSFFIPQAQAAYTEDNSLTANSLSSQTEDTRNLNNLLLAQNNSNLLALNSLSAEDPFLIDQESGGSFSESGSYISGPGVLPNTEEREDVVEYEVKEGDTVGSISIDFDISIDTILSANNLSADSYIHPGDKLKILPASGVLHKVKSGESLLLIAQLYDADLEEIKQKNNLDNEQIKAGEELFIPGANLLAAEEQAGSSYTPSQSQSSSYSAPVSSSTGFIWPALSRSITSGFGYRKWGSYTEFHKGVDIDGNTGNPIKSAQAGRIVFAGWKSGYGNTIMVDHGNGFTTLYGHMSAYRRTSGYVAQGEIIGYIGSTGRSTGSHLHFEIRVQGKAVNPLKYTK